MDYYNQALDIDREIGNKRGEGIRLGNIGIVYHRLGNYDKALEYYEQALEIALAIGDKIGEGMRLGNIANMHRDKEEFDRSLEYYEKTMVIYKEIGDQLIVGETLANIGHVNRQLGEFNTALDYYNQALKAVQELGYRKIEGFVFNGLGSVYCELNDFFQSEEHHKRALEIGQEIHFPIITWDAYLGLGMVNEQQGQLDESLRMYTLAVQEIEDVRRQLQSEETKSAYMESYIITYERIVHILYALHQQYPLRGYDIQAFEYAERSKARTLLDILHEGQALHNLENIEPDFREQLLDNESKLEEKYSELSETLSKREDERDNEKIISLENDVGLLQQQRNLLIQNMKETYPEYYALTNPEMLSLEAVQRNILQEHQVVFEYFVGEEDIYVLIITEDQMDFNRIEITP